MKKLALSLTVLLSCFVFDAVFAQHDSSHLDLGYTQLNKELTQHVTIRGADLEKMPFTNISDAISPWLNGVYTGPGGLMYVVDGNPVSDPNVYDIHDIEEITLVQDATALMGTGAGQQQLVLITTRRGKAKRGLTAAAQTGLVKVSGNGAASSGTAMFHQYYVGAYRKLDKISFGLSAAFQRDVSPSLLGDLQKTNTPLNLQRWRVNSYFDWRPDAHNLVEVTMNYTPQRLAMDVAGDANQYRLDTKAPQHFLQPRLRWQSELLPGLKNELQGTYLSSIFKGTTEQLAPQGTPISGINQSLLESKVNSHHWQLRDRLSYTLNAGGWRIEPAVTYSYEDVKETSIQSYQVTSNFGQPGAFPTSFYQSGSTLEGKPSLLTPALDITYLRTLNIQGGLLMNLSSPIDGGKKNLPFARVAVDFLQLGKSEKKNHLQLFGSYARRNTFSSNSYSLSDLGAGVTQTNPVYTYQQIPSMVNVAIDPTKGEPDYWAWELGIGYTSANGRLDLQYTLEGRNLSGLNYDPQPGGNYLSSIEQWHSTLHHFAVRAKVLDDQDLKWETGLNVTLLRSKPDHPLSVLSFMPGIGDVYPNKVTPTGGWVNRLRVGAFVAGLDLLYHFHSTGSLTTIVVPNIYAGYNFHLPHDNGLELFTECRGLIRNHAQVVLDGRKYYSLGGKITLQ